MVSPALAAEVTSAIRDFGTGMETQGHAFSSSIRHLVLSAAVSESSRVRIAREVHVPPAQFLTWIASALSAASSLLGSVNGDLEPAAGVIPGGFVAVDRSLTRC